MYDKEDFSILRLEGKMGHTEIRIKLLSEYETLGRECGGKLYNDDKCEQIANQMQLEGEFLDAFWRGIEAARKE